MTTTTINTQSQEQIENTRFSIGEMQPHNPIPRQIIAIKLRDSDESDQDDEFERQFEPLADNLRFFAELPFNYQGVNTTDLLSLLDESSDQSNGYKSSSYDSNDEFSESGDEKPSDDDNHEESDNDRSSESDYRSFVFVSHPETDDYEADSSVDRSINDQDMEPAHTRFLARSIPPLGYISDDYDASLDTLLDNSHSSADDVWVLEPRLSHSYTFVDTSPTLYEEDLFSNAPTLGSPDYNNADEHNFMASSAPESNSSRSSPHSQRFPPFDHTLDRFASTPEESEPLLPSAYSAQLHQIEDSTRDYQAHADTELRLLQRWVDLSEFRDLQSPLIPSSREEESEDEEGGVGWYVNLVRSLFGEIERDWMRQER